VGGEAFGACAEKQELFEGGMEDLSMFKNFVFFENRLTFQFRGEAFNATNTTHLNGPGATITGSTYGVITSANNPRQLQVALKVIF
jgi:hypothetical protein